MRTSLEVKMILVFAVGCGVTHLAADPLNRISRDVNRDIAIGRCEYPVDNLPRGEGTWPEELTRAFFLQARCPGH